MERRLSRWWMEQPPGVHVSDNESQRQHVMEGQSRHLLTHHTALFKPCLVERHPVLLNKRYPAL